MWVDVVIEAFLEQALLKSMHEGKRNLRYLPIRTAKTLSSLTSKA